MNRNAVIFGKLKFKNLFMVDYVAGGFSIHHYVVD